MHISKSSSQEKVRIFPENPDKVVEYQSGKEKLFGFFVGLVMKNMGGKANPELVNKLLKERLGSR